MNHASMLKQARTDGLKITLTPEGEITARGPQPAIAKWTPILRLHRPEIIALLKADAAPVAQWDANDWAAFFNERAAVAEFDGGLSRHEAESMAYRSCVSEWLCQNFQISEPGQCAQCQRGDLSGRLVMPYGDAAHGHTWLHGECWPAWYAHRRLSANAALKSIGLHEWGQPA
jgi:hypothetical protein